MLGRGLADEDVRPPGRRRSPVVRHPRRRNLRARGAQRRRQDDDPAHAGRAIVPSSGRPLPRRGDGRAAARCAPHRLPHRSARPLGSPDGAAEPARHARLYGLSRPDRAVDMALDRSASAIAPPTPPRCCRRDCGSASRWRGRPCTTRRGAADEPTSGLDPESARDLRELVVRLRHDAARRSSPRTTSTKWIGSPTASRAHTRLVALDCPGSLRGRAFGARSGSLSTAGPNRGGARRRREGPAK